MSKPIGKPHEIPPQHCLRCNFLMNAAGAPANVAVAPFPGCRTICIKCGELMIFDENMQLRLMTQEEYDKLPSSAKQDIEQMDSLIEILQRRN